MSMVTMRLSFDTTSLQTQLHELGELVASLPQETAKRLLDFVLGDLDGHLLDVLPIDGVPAVVADQPVQVLYRLRLGGRFERAAAAIRAGEVDGLF